MPRPAAGPDGHGALSDAELVAQVRGGRDSAYGELYRRHAEAVRRYARTCCRDAHTAEDLTGEVFARTLQAIRGGSGPESAVRAYLLTTVRRVAAAWGNSTRREHLVEDFAVFAVSSAGAGAAQATADVGADVCAMREAERSLAVQAFRTLPERWQTVLWHTAVEEESPSAIAPMLGLTPNATAVLAHRAREGLRQAYLQAHVSSALTAEGACARFADRLGAHARGALRTRADRELNRHLKECARCSAASMELADLNATLKGLLPVAYIGWFAAAAAAKAAAVVAGGTAAGAAAGAAAATASGGTGAAVGGGTGAAVGSGWTASGGAAAAEGLGAPVKAGAVAAGVVVAAAATAVALALTGGHGKPGHHRPAAQPSAASPVITLPPAPAKPSPRVPAAVPPPTVTSRPSPAPTTSRPAPTPALSPTPSPSPTAVAPRTPVPAPPASTSAPTPPPTTPPTAPPPTAPPPPPPPLVSYRLDALGLSGAGGGSAPTIRPSFSPLGWRWDRWGLSVGGTRYAHGVTVHAPSELTIDLNRSCVAYDAEVGVDDLARFGGAGVRFFVDGDGTPLWSSAVVRGGDPAVAAHVSLTGYRTLTLRVTAVRRGPGLGLGLGDLADWADAVIRCR
ncbi:sigma-70 family RNA polymerase sigma factor [Streptomyces sp. HPF1205]|uniref:sigma-70 family RNA polymerase sigma factor n=1 Tax=Streptomyces sp. HPF1205 TaxID=2873262 RepID=UPI001CEC4C05|nr:sigma-70 family RNA polymerase sigma factor [Streptomyces sp. HPF1205]